MDKVKITIIGAGCVGLAIAHELSFEHDDIIVLEKWDSFGRDTSSRNSEVIHAGIYYNFNSLKAKLCVEGNKLIYEMCKKKNIPYKNCGKIILATELSETDNVEELFKNAKKNNCSGLELISSKKINEMEPEIKGISGLFSKTTGIIDTHKFMKAMEIESEQNGVTFSYSSEVVNIDHNGEEYEILIKDSDGKKFSFLTEIVINCAGLYADKIASLAGIDIIKEDLRIDYYKGEYFSISNRHKGKIKRLIYPVPTPLSLGLHAVIMLDGSLKVGPNAFQIDTINYDVDETHRNEFFNESTKYMPFIEEADLQPDMSGIRPKLFYKNTPYQDFYISHEKTKGLKGFINLIGIESPGLTASPAIAKYVKQTIKDECL
ncbi:MAG: NAD(P)/FAD-dependent oxidoreductase [Candidatus Aureabacteria bacterium]|nr:NAD(P)/FAD-dependent oxidoreductase [Candidatus Auribacterota bacterium]